MTTQIKAVRGTTDILAGESARWSAVENLSRDLFAKYGYSEIRTPIFEETALFKRSIGDNTDIVQKQMYAFQDPGGRSITLRPEATAPVVRAYLEHHLDKKQAVTKLFYIGPMFRAERPQAGRQRQFHPIGIEAIGSDSPYLDAEAISLLAIFLEKAGVKDFEVKINNLGCAEDKKKLAASLKKKLKAKIDSLCEDCKERFEKNVLRILDCKKETCKKIVHSLSSMDDDICHECKKHFDKAREALDSLGVKYIIDNYLVRGLDYYTKTVFEAVGHGLGSQDAIAAGGRYDNLVKELGGPDKPAVGFAIGVERLLMAVGVSEHQSIRLSEKIYIATLGEAARKKGFELAAGLRQAGIVCQMEYDDKSLKAQLKAASNQDCKYAAILGDDELQKDKII